MELRHLEYFVAVAEERHFTRAAVRLQVSQSGLSASIRSLERELGAALFVRSTRSVALTEAGRALLDEASRTLASARAAREAVAATQGLLRGALTVGTEQCVAGVHPPSLLAAFHQRHPRVEIRLRQAGSLQLVEEVAAGRIDVAFVVSPDAPSSRVRMLPLTGEPMTLLCHRGHHLAGNGPVELGALGRERFVDLHPSWGPRRITDRAFTTAGVRRQVAFEVNDVHSLLELVQEGLGVAVAPAHFAAKPQAAGLVAVPLADTPAGPRPRYLSSAAAPADTTGNPAAHALLALLEATAPPA
ncbi:LysR family transcriptional regulator [Streptantibioticus cattleyicolor]|uniref:LysR family transcriptional regulator n=1 Tax=Streptantibioticus cattleyicolor (strain ATCC 35852 / DSM 46488 / JCM 4925 / NBRC 14057 / NRRL 8057) TaxID=1003195 RepID=F8JM76_STREN|nr:LysR family transcriptional regulator [Streptantibioticus cattleyicolor]AEW99392.1 LysR family transcriptional regulator [Streptantibioticus cattleyicolor NRRL 8057 = DSM 46488]CCB71566.1 putative LysR-family transcriptional regulator [Streptantibioticus cattleyicolor NRRL 8057 = DSM 46488]